MASPNPEQKHLRIVHCAGCEALQQQVEEMAVDMHGQEVEIKQYRRKVSRLEKQLMQRLEGDPDHKMAERLFEYWKHVTGHGRAIFDTDRETNILRGLKILERKYGDDAPRALAAAFLGIARKGFVDPVSQKRHDRIGLVCKSAETLEKNIERYRDYMREQGKEPVV